MGKLTARVLSGIATFAAAGAITLVGVAPASAAGVSQDCQANYQTYGFSSPHDCIVASDNGRVIKHRR